MPIASDLEKLVLLRDNGDLSQAEFEKAKERLLTDEVAKETPASKGKEPSLPEESEEGKPKQILLIAILSTVAAALSGGAAAINPSPLGVLAFAGFTTAAALNWNVFAKSRVRK
ncbi:MAG: SHOCT domain-containing protein [Akkermansiaceae bacterium]|nr:SHOCT domain-containing protein [Akkermansiaceae bacterium]